MADSDTLRRLWRYKSDLEEGPDEEKLIQILKKLYRLHVSITSLQETGIGKVVNTFKHQEGVVGDWAKKVVTSWKTAVQQEIQKQEELKRRQPSPEYKDNGEKSDGSEDSWTSWDGDRQGNIKQEKQDDINPSSGEGCGDTDSIRPIENDHKTVKVKRERSESDHKTVKVKRERSESDHKTVKVKRERSETDDKKSHTKNVAHHHHDSVKIKKEKSEEKVERKRETQKEINARKEKVERKREKHTEVDARKEKNIHSPKENDDNDDDLTDSDAEPEQSTSDFNSIEQYCKTMLGQVETENNINGHKKSEKSKLSGSGYKSGNHSHSTSSVSEGRRDGSSKSRGSTSSMREGKPKSGESCNDSKNAKVDRKRKNHSMSESDEDGGQTSPGHLDGRRDRARSSSKHSDRKESHHQSSHKVSSSSTSHHNSSSSKSSSKSSHSHSSSHHSSSSKSSSSSSKSSNINLSSSHSSHRSKVSSSSDHSKSTSSSHRKPSSQSTSSSSHRKPSSQSTSSSSHRKPSSQSSSNNEVVKRHDNGIPLYIPTPVTVKKEKKEDLYSLERVTDQYDPNNSGSDHDYLANTYSPSREIKEEKVSTDSSDHEHAYKPSKKIKTEKTDSGSSSPDISYKSNKKVKKEKRDYSQSEDSDSDAYSPRKEIKKEKRDPSQSEDSDSDTYSPRKKIKKEKRDSSQSEDSDSSAYSPCKKIKIEKNNDKSCDRDKEEQTSSYRVDDRGDESDKVYKNKYLDAVGKVQSEDGDEERYSPTHGWKVKEEKTSEDYRYGGGVNRNQSSASDVDGAESDQPSPPYVPSSKKDVREKGESYSSSKSHRVDGKGDRHSTGESKSRSEVSKDKMKTKDLSSHKHDNGRHRPHESSSSKSPHSHGKSNCKPGRSHGEQNRQSSSHTNKSDSTDIQSKKTSHSYTDKNSSKSSSSLKHDSQVSTTSSSKNSKTSEPHKKKKSKPKQLTNTESGFDLFSETIHIKKELVTLQVLREKKTTEVPSIKSKVQTSPTLEKHSKYTKTDTNTSSSKFDGSARQRNSESASKVSSSKVSEKEADLQKVTTPKKKEKETVHIDDSEMSFEDFLNFDEAAILKKTTPKSTSSKSHSSKKSSSSSSSKHGANTTLSPSSTQSGSSVPTPSTNITLTQEDLMSLLPPTQAHYRPIRKNPLYEEDENQGEVEPYDPEMVGVKSSVRSKVYSGKKHVNKEMKSLHELCLLVLIDNIDAIDHVGPIPYFILKPVLERCTAEQLYRLEDLNPHFIEDSEELWEMHSKREFMGSKPEELETWRELFLRKFEEREAKYQKLKAKMTLTTVKGQAGRAAKLAYVDTVAKPPREVLRQQKRHGTGCVRKNHRRAEDRPESGASSLRAYKPSLTIPAHNPINDRPNAYRPTPPMLARALQMRKNMRR